MLRSSFVLALSFLASTALAVPASLPVQGVLSDAEGVPLDGEVGVTFRLTRDADGLDELFVEAQVIDVREGSFTVYLGDVEPLELGLLTDETEVWLQVQIDGDEPMNPVRLGSAAYAGSADVAFEAETLQGASLDDILGQVPDDEAIESLAMGVCYDEVSELRTALDAVYMAIGDDVDWSQLLSVPADLADGDDDTTYTAGTGLLLTAGEFSTDDAHINTLAQDVVDTPGSLDVALLDYLATYGISFDDLTDVPGGLADGDDDTTYEAAVDGGLLLDAGAFAIDQDLLDTWILETAGISGSFDDTVQSYLDTVGITGSVDDAIATYLDSVGLSGSVDDAIAAYLLATPVSWNDLSDIPSDLADGDDDTTYTAGDGLSLSGTELSADWSAVDARILATSGITTSVDDSIQAYLDGIGLSGSVDDAIADYLDSIGLSGSVDDAIADYLSSNPVAFSDLADIPTDLADGDDDTTYSAGSGLSLSGTTFAIDETTVRNLAADEVASASLTGLTVDGDMEVTGELLGAALNEAGDALRICTGESNDTWTVHSGNYSIYKDISIASCGFTSTPIIISSLHGTSSHWQTTGAQNIYSPSSTSFRVYVNQTGATHVTPSQAATYDWHIEWVAIGN